MQWYDKIFRPKRMELSSGKVVFEKASRKPFIVVLFLIAIVVSGKITGFQLSVLCERGSQFFVILGQMFLPPKLSYFKEIINPLLDTIKMSFLGSFFGGVVAIPFSTLAASNLIKQRAIVASIRFLFSMIRTLPTLVSALIATYIFGLGTMAGTIAIFLFTFSYVGKQLYEQIETVDMGSFEALEAIGANKSKGFLASILPQVLPSYLSICLFCFEGNVRYASILGYVGAGGLGLILNEKIGWREYGSVGSILIALFFTVVCIESLSHYIRMKLA